MARPSTREAALVDPTRHAFIRGGGYIAFEDHEQSQLVHGPLMKSCDPPVGTQDKTPHLLAPPNGALPMSFMWLKRQGVWMRHGGNRLGFTARYLGSHGWTYVRPV